MNHLVLVNHASWARWLKLRSPEQWSEQQSYWKSYILMCVVQWILRLATGIIIFSLSQMIWADMHYKKNTLPWWYVFVTVGRVFFHACTSMKNLWQNQDSHTCAVVEVFHDITKIIITEVSTSMTINHASQKCFRQGWPTRGIHCNGTPLSYRVGFWIR